MLYECSDKYDSSIMEKALGDMYMHWTVKVQSTDFGLLASRGRLYGVCLLRHEVLARWGSLENVIPLFHRRREHLGDLTNMTNIRNRNKSVIDRITCNLYYF